MRIRIDAHHATKVERRLVPAPIKVKPPRICVDFNSDAVFGAGREDFLDIDVVPRTAQKLASGHMPKDGGPASEQRDELAPFHSITSSASASNVGGTSRPSAMAVFRLSTSSTLVDRMTGRSAGFSPFRIRPA